MAKIVIDSHNDPEIFLKENNVSCAAWQVSLIICVLIYFTVV